MYVRSALAAATALGTAALLTMGAQSCGPKSGGGATTGVSIPVIGLGAAPAGGAVVGTWVRVPGTTKLMWVPVTITAAAMMHQGYEILSNAEKIPNASALTGRLNDPCKGKDWPTYKIAKWTAKLPAALQGKVTGRKGYSPYLDCYYYQRFTSKKKFGLPARIKYLYDCIANIIANGSVRYQQGLSSAKVPSIMIWEWKDGYIITGTTGRINEINPVDGGWGNCARATPL
jgi:hypothetical protein